MLMLVFFFQSNLFDKKILSIKDGLQGIIGATSLVLMYKDIFYLMG